MEVNSCKIDLKKAVNALDINIIAPPTVVTEEDREEASKLIDLLEKSDCVMICKGKE